MDNVNSGYVSLGYVAKSFIGRTGGDDREYEKILQLVIDGYLELGYTDVIPNVQTTKVTVNEQNVAPFPDDYINYVSISVQHEGRLVPLILNRNIVPLSTQSCGVWERDSKHTKTNGEFTDVTSVRHSELQANYTQGGGFGEAYYKIDNANRQIVFLTKSWVGFEFILVYKGTNLSDKSIVDRDVVPALREFVYWQKAHYQTPQVESESAIARKERRWRTERDKLYARKTAFNESEWIDTVLTHTHRGLK